VKIPFRIQERQMNEYIKFYRFNFGHFLGSRDHSWRVFRCSSKKKVHLRK